MNRIVEHNFVPTKRYAELLIEEIPIRQRIQVALAVYQRKNDVDEKNLRLFFDTVLQCLTPEDAQELFEAVSTELRESSDDSDLISVLKLLRPEDWSKLDEAARLRTENRLIRNAQDGLYMRKANKCTAGGMATWSKRFFPYFTLKNELLNVFVKKLWSSSVESQDYVLNFFFPSLETLADKPPHWLQRVLAKKLESGESRFKEALEASLFTNWTWDEKVTKALESFKPAEPLPEDDVPF